MSGIRLHFGCGGNILDGWENYDIEMDLSKLPLPFPDNTASFIFSEHCIEHFPSPQVVKILEEFRRILKPGGTVRICCPVLDDITDPKHARSLLVDHGHCVGLTKDLLVKFLWVAGFRNIAPSIRLSIDGHHEVIGLEKDDLETCRLIGIK